MAESVNESWFIKLRILVSPGVLAPLTAIVIALAVGGMVLLLTGHNPVRVYHSIFSSAFCDHYGLSETLLRTVPLSLCALSIAFCLNASIWNIGAEGQMLIGSVFATWASLNIGHYPSFIAISLALLAGIAGGMLWASIAGILKSRFDVNEILTTLLTNYIAVDLVSYFVYGPWKDPGNNFPHTPTFHENVWLPCISWQRLHIGCFFILLVALMVYVLLKYTRLGFKIRVIGDNQQAALYAGIKVKTVIFITILLAGALSGMAGAIEVIGVEHKLHHNMARGLGYTGIIIAWLAGKHALWVIPVSFLMAGIAVGGEMTQITNNTPLATVNVLQGVILLFILFSEVIKEKISFLFLKKRQ